MEARLGSGDTGSAGRRRSPAGGQRPTQTIRATLGALLGLCMAALMTHTAMPLRRTLAWIGQRSLPIFLGHSLVLVPGFALVGSLTEPSAGLKLLIIPIMCGVATAGSLLLHALAVRCRAGWIYALPRDTTHRVLAHLLGRQRLLT